MTRGEFRDEAEGSVGDIEYRPLSGLAITCFVASLVVAIMGAMIPFGSIMKSILPVLVLFSVGVVSCAILAFLKIRNPDNQLTGGRFAALAIALSIFSVSFAITFSIALDNRMNSLAQTYSEQWFKLIRDKDFYRAHQLTIQVEARVNVNNDEHLKAFYDPQFVLVRHKDEPPEKPINSLEMLKNSDPLVSLGHLGDQARIRCLGRDAKAYFNDTNREIFSIIFEMNPNIHKANEPMVFKLSLERKRMAQPFGIQWRVVQSTYISGGPPMKLEISK